MLTNLRRRFIASRFKSKNLNIIEGLPLPLALSILETFIGEGWQLGREFTSVSSLEFQGKCTIQRGQSTLSFEYSQDEQYSITGPARIVSAIAKQYDLVALSTPTDY